ncbi:hypothetical protein PG994_005565 [Apiospora phragmitis]|uniref:Uncharacterized protein n=1 Tax=Apiospora phragmitis TaxID=2905665 RepID=A0ABR1VCL6_9PEZI
MATATSSHNPEKPCTELPEVVPISDLPEPVQPDLPELVQNPNDVPEPVVSTPPRSPSNSNDRRQQELNDPCVVVNQLERLGLEPGTVQCPFCDHRGKTQIKEKHSNRT